MTLKKNTTPKHPAAASIRELASRLKGEARIAQGREKFCTPIHEGDKRCEKLKRRGKQLQEASKKLERLCEGLKLHSEEGSS